MDALELILLIIALLCFIGAAWEPIDAAFPRLHLGWLGMIPLTFLLVVV